MPTIPNHRQLAFQLKISRPDGVTWEDLTEYLARAAVEMGDVSGVGTGNTGVDGVARRLEFALRNDGPVVPGLFAWPADGTVAADRTLAADDTVEASATDGSWLARLLNQQAFNLRDSFAPRDRLSRWNWWNGQYEPLLDANREVIFRVSPDGGTTWRTEFHGLLGARIITRGSRVECHAEDLSKPLRRKFIKEPREYGSAAGTPVEDVIQQILDDYMGAQAPTLYVPVPTGAVISSEPEPWTVEYMSVWDAIQKAAAEIGWWLGYRWVDAAQDYVLTLMEPPTNKSTADFELDWTDDFYAEEEEITDQYVRNDVTVYYRDTEGNRQSVNAKDSDSIAKFGEVSMLIEENNADLIRTQEAALRLANSALHSLAWMTSETRIEMPYLPGLDVFSTISRTNPQVSSEADFYAVHSLRVTFDFEAHRYRAECIAAGRVITGRSRWLRMETRPGSPGQPQEPKPPTLGQPGTPLGLTGQFSGLDAIFTWQPSIYRHWQRDKVEVYIGGVLKRTAYVANNVFVYTLDMNRQDNATPSPQVEVRVYHEYTTGALSPPAIVAVNHPAPAAPTVEARSSSAQVRWAVTSEPPVGWKDTIVEAGSLQETVAALAGVIDAQEAGLADGQIATVSVRVRNVFGQMSSPGTAQTTVNYLDKLQFAQDIKPVVLVSTLPQLPNPEYPQGSVVFLTTDNKLYRSTGTAWTAEVPTTDLAGTITETQIGNDAVTTPKLKAGAVTTDKLAAEAVTADKLAANSVTAGKIAAGAVKADAIDVDELSAISADLGTVTAGQLQTPDGKVKVGQDALGSGKHGLVISDGSETRVLAGDLSGVVWRGQALPNGTYGQVLNNGYLLITTPDGHVITIDPEGIEMTPAGFSHPGMILTGYALQFWDKDKNPSIGIGDVRDMAAQLGSDMEYGLLLAQGEIRATQSVFSNSLIDYTVTSSVLAPGSVLNDKLPDGVVTLPKLNEAIHVVQNGVQNVQRYASTSTTTTQLSSTGWNTLVSFSIPKYDTQRGFLMEVCRWKTDIHVVDDATVEVQFLVNELPVATTQQGSGSRTYELVLDFRSYPLGNNTFTIRAQYLSGDLGPRVQTSNKYILQNDQLPLRPGLPAYSVQEGIPSGCFAACEVSCQTSAQNPCPSCESICETDCESSCQATCQTTSQGGGGCIREGTPITIWDPDIQAYREVPVEQLQPGMILPGYNPETDTLEHGELIRLEDAKFSNRFLRIHTDNGPSVDVTYTQPFDVLADMGDGWRWYRLHAKFLKPGMKLVRPFEERERRFSTITQVEHVREHMVHFWNPKVSNDRYLAAGYADWVTK